MHDANAYENKGDGTENSISFNLPAGESMTVTVTCKATVDELNALRGKDVAKLNFEARQTNYDADFYVAGPTALTPQTKPARINFNFDPGMFQRADNTQFNKDIAKFACCMATTAKSAEDSDNPEMRGCNVIPDGYSYDRNDPVGFAKAMGFENPYYYDMANPGNEIKDEVKSEVTKPSIDYYKDDLLAYWLAHKKVNINGRDSEIILLGIQGTNGSLEEWTSDFDIGSDSKEYYDAVG